MGERGLLPAIHTAHPALLDATGGGDEWERLDARWGSRRGAVRELEPVAWQSGSSSRTALEGRVTRFEGLESVNPEMLRLFETCARIAPTPASVLLLGETGTGKELFARAIHERSGRTGRYVAVNCAAIPEALVESELFGHEKGAFTGAERDKPGLFRQAGGGTLMLDEIGSLDLGAQCTLLRTLQEHTVRPLGTSRELPVDVRVVAATSVPLFEAVRAGRFRADLLYRLDVIRLEVPPLRERPDDVLHLFRQFCEAECERYHVEQFRLGAEFLDAVVRFVWPGNVRQLKHFVERLVLTGGERRLDSAREFDAVLSPHRPRGTSLEGTSRLLPDVDLSLSLAEHLDRHERIYMAAVLNDAGGCVQAAASRAGVNRRTILRKLKKHGLDKEAFAHPSGGAGSGSEDR